MAVLRESLRGSGCSRQRQPAWDVVRIFARQRAEHIFLHRDLAFRVRNRLSRRFHQLLGLPHIQQAGGAAALQRIA